MKLTLRLVAVIVALFLVTPEVALARGGSSRGGGGHSSGGSRSGGFSRGSSSRGGGFSRSGGASRSSGFSRSGGSARSSTSARSGRLSSSSRFSSASRGTARSARVSSQGRSSGARTRSGSTGSRISSSGRSSRVSTRSTTRAPRIGQTASRSTTQYSMPRGTVSSGRAGSRGQNAQATDRLRSWSRARTTRPSLSSRGTTGRSTRTASRTSTRSLSRGAARTTTSSRGDTNRLRSALQNRGSSTRGGSTRSSARSSSRSSNLRGRMNTRFGGRGDVRTNSRRGSADALATRAGVRSSARGGVRSTARGGVRHSQGGGRAGVRYGSDWRAGYRGGRHYSYGGAHYARHWRGSRYYGYYAPCHGWGGSWGVYWNPWWYSCYSPFWVAGVPAFGFGVTWCGSGSACYDDVDYAEPIVIERRVIIEQAPEIVEQAPVILEEGDEEPLVVPEDEGENAPEAPGLQDFKLGIEAFRAGSFETALRHFKAAAEVEETNGEAWMAVFQAAFAEGEYEEAADALATAADIGAFPRGYRFDPSPIYPSEKVFEQALALLDKHLVKHPKDADAHLVRTYFHVAQGERDEAHAGILKVLELYPSDATAPLLSIALLPPLPPEKVEPEQE